MTTRAERRQKRADGKRGRRAALRVAELDPNSRQALLERLYAQGVTVAKPRIWTPEDAA
jgi:hypothetical protein